MIHFVVPAKQEFGFTDYLDVMGGALKARSEIVHYEALPARSAFRTGTYVFSALDQLTPTERTLATDLHGALAAAPRVRLLNDPLRTLQRFELLTALRELRRNQHGVVRATGDWCGLRYPVFLREERQHTGNISPLLYSEKEIEAAIGLALVEGRRLANLLVLEFLDTADAENVYRKYAAFVVGGHVIARHVAVGTQWMMKHSAVVYTPELAREHLAFVKTNPHERELAEIAAIANVGYGRIDYAIKDGRVEVWEINLNPTIGPRPNEQRKPEPDDVRIIRDEARTHFYRRLREAFEAVDVDAPPPELIPVRFDPRVARAAVARPRRLRSGETLKLVLQPVKPLVQPLVARSARLIGWAARRLHTMFR